MGLPGSGKTTLANEIIYVLTTNNIRVTYSNADIVRKLYNDWDFTIAGRERQAVRMREIADSAKGIVICDFIAPTDTIRQLFAADYTIWVDTIAEGRFEDTNKLFEPPKKYDIRVTEQNSIKWASIISEKLINIIRMEKLHDIPSLDNN